MAQIPHNPHAMGLPPTLDESKQSAPAPVRIADQDEYPDGGGLWDERYGAPPYLMSSNPSTLFSVQVKKVVTTPSPFVSTQADRITVAIPRRHPPSRAGGLLRIATTRSAWQKTQEIQHRAQIIQAERIKMANKDLLDVYCSPGMPLSPAVKTVVRPAPPQQGLRHSVTAPPSSRPSRRRKWISKCTEQDIIRYYRTHKGCTHKDVAENFDLSRSAITKVLKRKNKAVFPSYYIGQS